MGLEKENFLKFIVCPTCDTLDENGITRNVLGQECSKICTFIQFPSHP